MKKIIYLLILLTVMLSLGCKKKTPDEEPAYTCTSCKTTPDAVAANNASNKGIYKGVIIGSSGTIKFDLQNTGATITAVMVLDGVTCNLTSTVTAVAGTNYVGAFTGTFAGQPVSITFSVGATGGSPIITTSSIPGHANASFSVLKEDSSSLLECFEGTYDSTKPEKGTFNLILSRGLKMFSGATRKDLTTVSNPFKGTISANNELLDSSNGRSIATLTGDVLAATFIDSNGAKIVVAGKRTF